MTKFSSAQFSTLAFWYAASHVSRAIVSCRFRIGHFSELLPGAHVVVSPRFPRERLPDVKTVVCVRPYVDKAKARELHELRSRGVRLVADFDDLLFGGRPRDFPSVVQGRARENVVATRIGIYRRGLALFDSFHVSTTPLARQLEAAIGSDRPISVVPNGLSRAWVRAGRAASRTYRDGDPKVLRYFAGSPTHDADLVSVAPAIARTFARHRDLTLELAGHFDSVALAIPADRVRRVPVRPYMLLPNLIAPTWVSIAPLVDSAFARCKSDVKFLEAGAFGVPTLASRGLVYGAHHGHGLVACESLDEWEAALESMLDPRVRAETSERALARIESRGYADVHRETFLGALSSEAAA